MSEKKNSRIQNRKLETGATRGATLIHVLNAFE